MSRVNSKCRCVFSGGGRGGGGRGGFRGGGFGGRGVFDQGPPESVSVNISVY